MNITVPAWAREHFWEELPNGSREFWAFRFKPRCQIGDTINFRFDRRTLATAKVAEIQPPGLTFCEETGRFKNLWKVYWNPGTFQDLRTD